MGLSNYNKVLLWTTLMEFLVWNRITGEVFKMDTEQARLARLRRRIFKWAEVMAEHHARYQVVMITLTYRRASQWRAGHIKGFMAWAREHAAGRLVGYAWVMEMQARGVPHYHVLLVMEAPYKRLPKPDESKGWTHGSSRIEKARTLYYIAKYASKVSQKGDRPPKGARQFCVWANPAKCEDYKRENLRRSAFPAYIRDFLSGLPFSSRPRVKRMAGGFEVNGVFIESPFRIQVT